MTKMKTVSFYKFGLSGFCILLILLLYTDRLSEQSVLAQTIGQTSKVTLENLGYEDTLLEGPLASTSYAFALPPDWVPQAGSFVELDVDYTVAPRFTDQPISAQMEVSLNNRRLHVEPFLDSSTSRQVRIGILPEALFLLEDNAANVLSINFVVDASCEEMRQTTLNIKNISGLQFNYLERPLILDLALYPHPIFQPNSFGPDQLYVLHSAPPSAGELQAITAVTAKLGEVVEIEDDLTITTTTDISASEAQMANSHVLIVGSPENNPLIAQLPLPIPAVERQLSLWSEMPATVVRGQVFSYTLNVQNTSPVTQTLNVTDRLPLGTTFLHCSGDCRQDQPGLISWRITSLAPGAEASTTIAVVVTEAIPPDQPLEHIATLYDSNNTPINADSLTVELGLVPNQQFVRSPEQKGTYFFAKNGVEVAENDGLVQEIQSPWSKRHVAIIVTGLSDEALFKAAQALSGQNRYPGMLGQYAIIQNTRPFTGTIETLQPDFTLADLGFRDETLKGDLSLNRTYGVRVPASWEIAEGARFNLHFAHSPAFSEISSTLNIRLNDLIIAGTSLGQTNTTSNTLVASLPQNSFRAGHNRLEILLGSSVVGDKCIDVSGDRFWLTVFGNSSFSLPHETMPTSSLDLDFYPRPFTEDPNLNHLVISLPNPISQDMIQELVRMAFMLGSGSSSDGFSPRVVFGDQNTLNDWREYNIIAIGLPTDNPFIAEVNDLLPQPFYPGTTEILQRINNVIYRLSPNTSLGFVQELPSPLNPQRAMLVVTGTNGEGLGWAQAILRDQRAFDLEGNLAIIRSTDIQNIDTRSFERQEVLSSTQHLVPEFQPVATITPTPTPTSTPTPVPQITATPEAPQPDETIIASEAVPNVQPVWLRPLLIFSIVLFIVAAGAAIWQNRR